MHLPLPGLSSRTTRVRIVIDVVRPNAAGGANRVSRRAVLLRIGVLTALAKLGVVGANEALSQETPPQAADPGLAHEIAHAMEHDPVSLKALDLLGTAAFVDAMVALAQKSDSVVQKLCMLVGLPTVNTGPLHEHEIGSGHELHKFPVENIAAAGILNVVRATGFGDQERHETIHEFETTLLGVALLMGLTSIAKGIVKSGHAVEMATTAEPKPPEETLADSIFQLTAVAAATQLPLSSFGNAAIGNAEFKQVDDALKIMYLRLLPRKGDGVTRSAGELADSIRSALLRHENPEITRRVTVLLKRSDLAEYHDFHKALTHEARLHSHDLMTILMATACDDTQASVGDPGPLIGLFQTVGVDFLHAVPALAPYTMVITIDRAMFAASRAGISNRVFTRERFQYMKNFVMETWKNLVLYFVYVAPTISSKITGKSRFQKIEANSSSVNFSLAEQVLKDIEAGIGAVMDAVLGSFNGMALEHKKLREALAELQHATKEWQADIGKMVARRIYPTQQEEARITKEEITSLQNKVVGAKSNDLLLQELQIDLAKLAANAEMKAIDEFAAHLADIRKDLGPELLHAAEELRREIGNKPSVLAIAKVLAKNPRIRDLVDFNFWHDRIGPALTDTMFVVLLQGLHLPFLINTFDRVIYKADWFRRLPLKGQEWTSIVFNYAGGMFADNWAICIAQVKWMTNIYFNQLDMQVRDLANDFPEVRRILREGFFQDSVTQLTPQRFAAKAEQTAALVTHLKANHADRAAELDGFLQQYLQDAETFYFRAVVASMLNSVSGAGQSLLGDSTHFTFAAGEKDFTLKVTLDDFKRHPLYHTWELIFTGLYATTVGPMIAQEFAHPIMSKAGIGFNIADKFQQLLQGNFRKQFPGFDEKLRMLQESQGA